MSDNEITREAVERIRVEAMGNTSLAWNYRMLRKCLTYIDQQAARIAELEGLLRSSKHLLLASVQAVPGGPTSYDETKQRLIQAIAESTNQTQPEEKL